MINAANVAKTGKSASIKRDTHSLRKKFFIVNRRCFYFEIALG
jgi:hypothetical protein